MGELSASKCVFRESTDFKTGDCIYQILKTGIKIQLVPKS